MSTRSVRLVTLVLGLTITAVAYGDGTPQAIPFSQAWTEVGLITLDDNWSAVPGIIGYRGDGLTSGTAVNPQTVVADGSGTPFDVNANLPNPNIFTTGGVAEFQIADPVVALQGSGTARAPHIVLHLDTTGQTGLTLAYNLRDVDGSADNAVQPVALQYRVGSSGNFTNIPAGFVADATTGPSLATLVTPVSVALPAAALNQPEVQIRILTTDAVGSDEWVGIDDISVNPGPPPPTPPTGLGAADPALVEAGGLTLLKVAVTPGSNPTSTDLQVHADLSSIGGSSTQELADDGTGGDVMAGDGVFSYLATIPFGTSSGARLVPATVSDGEGRSSSTEIRLGVRSDVVISQVYGGGGNTGAALTHDFIELFNRGTSPVSLAGWSVQYASAGGTTWTKTDLTSSIAPGGYYLVQQAAGTGGTTPLPTPDDSGGITMAAASGKVALVTNGTLLTGSCPWVPSLQDLVGYGGANCSEGNPTAPPGNTTAALRGFDGCTDTNNNAADFATGVPNPRNSASPFHSCVPTALAIHEIQGDGPSSPHGGAFVSTSGIVTGRKGNGFFIQAPDGEADTDSNTSEGIFVFTSSAPPASAAVGNRVSVVGLVQEFVPFQDPNSPPTTEIVGPPLVSLQSTGHALPTAVMLGIADTDPTGPIEQLERYEGMRVEVASLTAVAPTQGSVTETTATSVSNGVFYGVITGLARPFREPGIQVPDPAPAGSPCCIPAFDANPERLRVDSDGQPGAPALEVTSGAFVTGLVGPLDYAFRTYTILPDPPPSAPPVVTGNASAVPVRALASDEFSVASTNLERFFDDVNDPALGEPVLTSTAFQGRLGKASLWIREVLRTPDILGVVEVENLGTLQALASRINADAVAALQPNPGYEAHLFEGNDVGGIDVGFLVKAAPRVAVIEVAQEGKDATYINPNNGLPELLNDRPSVVLRATVQPPSGLPAPVTVIVNHLRSLNGIADPVDGHRVRTKRRAQAEFLADLVQSRQAASPGERIVLVGDFNAFEFSDGYVDSIGTIKGTPVDPNTVVLASDDLVNPDLVDVVDLVGPAQRYSYSFDGNAQVLDHVLVTQSLLPFLRGLHFARGNADSPESFRNDATRPERISDHDAPVVYFSAASIGGTSPAALWLGLKNSDDQGTRFDVRVALRVNGVLVALGETRCVTGLTRNPGLAKEVSVPFGPIASNALFSGDVITFDVAARIGTNSDGTRCGGHGSAVGLRLYYDSVNRPSRFGAEITPDPLASQFLRASGDERFFDAAPPTGGVAKQQDSGPIQFSGGNPWKTVGSWSRSVP